MSAITSLITGGSNDYAPMQTATPEQLKQQYDQSQQAIQQQQAFAQAVQAQNGLGKQLDQYNQFGNVAAGQGPNPAQAMLNNATGQNVQNQAALMGSQRGAGQNAGLVARQAAQQGGALQQQAVGQGAAMQAQQQLAAMGQQANMANQMAAQQGQAQGAYTNAALQGQQNMLGAAGNYNQQQAQMRSAQLEAQGNVMGALGRGAMLLGGGGGAAASGILAGSPKPVDDVAAEGGIVDNGRVLKPGARSHIAQYFASGGQVNALVSPGEKYLPPQAVQQVAKGANPMSVGQTIPGKPKVEGAVDSYQNDNVQKVLQEGGIVLPRSVTKAKNPDKAAEAFVNAILAKKGKGLKR